MCLNLFSKFNYHCLNFIWSIKKSKHEFSTNFMFIILLILGNSVFVFQFYWYHLFFDFPVFCSQINIHCSMLNSESKNVGRNTILKKKQFVIVLHILFFVFMCLDLHFIFRNKKYNIYNSMEETSCDIIHFFSSVMYLNLKNFFQKQIIYRTILSMANKLMN